MVLSSHYWIHSRSSFKADWGFRKHILCLGRIWSTLKAWFFFFLRFYLFRAVLGLQQNWGEKYREKTWLLKELSTIKCGECCPIAMIKIGAAKGENNQFFFFLVFCLFRAAPTAYRGSQARGLIGATAAGHSHSHSNTRSEPCLRPTPQLTAMPDP